MSINLGSAFGKVSLDASGVRTGVQESVAGFGQVEQAGDSMGQKIAQIGEQIGSAMTQAGQALTLGLTVPILAMGAASVNSAMGAEDAIAELNQTIASTKGVAGVSAASVIEYATSMQKVTKFGDEAIISGQSMLLTFTNIGASVFPRASTSMLNMAQKFGSMEAASMQLGKALNDPIEGVAALRRVGVKLTDQQEKQIKYFVETNQIAKAQGIILGELEVEFGGLAEAAGRTASGKLEQFKNALDDTGEIVGGILLPPLLMLLVVLGHMNDAFQSLPSWMQTGIVMFGLLLAAVGPVLMVLGWLVSTIASVVGAWPAIIAILPIVGTALGSVAAVITGTVIPALVSALVAAAPFILAILAIAAVAGLLYLAWVNNFGGIQDHFATFMVSWNAGIQGWTNFGNGFAAKWAEGLNGWGNFFAGIGRMLVSFGVSWDTGIAGWKSFGDGFDAKWQEGLDGWDNFFSGINRAAADAWAAGLQGWSNFFAGMLAIAAAKMAQLRSLGQSIVQGIQQGFQSAIQGLITSAINSIQDLIRRIRDLLGIHSPSAVFANFGEMSGAGLEGGFTKRVRQMVRNIPNIMGPMTVAASASLAGANVGAGGGAVSNSYDQRRAHYGNTTNIIQNPSRGILQELMG